MTLPAPIPVDEAQRRILELVEPLGPELVRTEDALGRHLAEPLVAQRTQPAADLSAMDGYAVRGDDLAGPWRVIGESAAGHPFAGEVPHGGAVRISTGAAMPAGTAAVLLQEGALREGDALRPLPDGEASPRHVRAAGFDFRRGARLLGEGTRLGPGQIALALMGGHGAVPVARLPHVAILDSGDELSADVEACGPHQIPASNGAMLAAMAHTFSASITRLGPVPDRLPAITAALASAERADVLVTSGGASVGDHDLIRPALEAWGARVAFWRVAIRPGKPLMVARRGRQLVLGLPGNPVSSYVTAYLFLLPALRALGGAPHPLPMPVTASLLGGLPASGDRTEFVRARYAGGEVMPHRQQDSSSLVSLADSNALIMRPAHCSPSHAGDRVTVFLPGDAGSA